MRAIVRKLLPASWITAIKLIGHSLKRFSSIRQVLDIEVADCNLRCAMCPNSEGLGMQRGRKAMMDMGLFKRIIDKVVAERMRFRSLWFGNWGESLLNPALPEMIRYARARMPKTEIIVYGNLNVLKDPAAFVGSGVDIIAVSMSGMTQEVYAKNHCNGNVSVVLDNLKRLIHERKQIRRPVNIKIRFHEYIYNKQDSGLAREFCRENGLEFEPVRCFIPGLEANVEYHKDKPRWEAYYRKFIDLDREEGLMKALSDYRECLLLNNQVTIDTDGRLYRCCAVYAQSNLLGSFFDHPIRRIQQIRSPICSTCARTPVSWRW
jgi:MoaA/NifB/PqqE/SkfB family radical SAM enzyme